MRKMLLPALLAACLPSTAAALSPSWCSSERLNPSERIICTDGILSRLDLALNEAYERARKVEPDLDQSAWLARRNACGTEISCLEAAYRLRISDLRGIASAAGQTTPTSRTDAITVGPISYPEQSPARRDNAFANRTAFDSDFINELEDLLREHETPRRDGPREEPKPRDESGGEAVTPAWSATPEMSSMLDQMVPRPWCDARHLNPTERTICGDVDLSQLDALLELAYGRTTARNEDAAQIQWLRSERDACGRDVWCIARAYADRIEALDAPAERAADPRRDVFIPAGQYPPPGSCRVWFFDRSPGDQPPPTSCDVRVPSGAVLIRG